MSYAEGTRVPEDRSRAELERILEKAGATEFAYGWGEVENPPGFIRPVARVGFKLKGFPVRIRLPMPKDADYAVAPGGRERTELQRKDLVAQERRRRWRALLLVVKAKLEAVATGITTLESEFLGDLVMPNGVTISERLLPDLRKAVEGGRLPNLLGAGS